MDRVLGKSTTALYGLVSGGIRDNSPTVFPYQIDTKALDRWEYMCPLLDLSLNFMPSRWSGSTSTF
ncbi:hypothetical protein V1522DRAFT_414533 [Lipomyces starkeyi]